MRAGRGMPAQCRRKVAAVLCSFICRAFIHLAGASWQLCFVVHLAGLLRVPSHSCRSDFFCAGGQDFFDSLTPSVREDMTWSGFRQATYEAAGQHAHNLRTACPCACAWLPLVDRSYRLYIPSMHV